NRGGGRSVTRFAGSVRYCVPNTQGESANPGEGDKSNIRTREAGDGTEGAAVPSPASRVQSVIASPIPRVRPRTLGKETNPTLEPAKRVTEPRGRPFRHPLRGFSPLLRPQYPG